MWVVFVRALLFGFSTNEKKLKGRRKKDIRLEYEVRKKERKKGLEKRKTYVWNMKLERKKERKKGLEKRKRVGYKDRLNGREE